MDAVRRISTPKVGMFDVHFRRNFVCHLCIFDEAVYATSACERNFVWALVRCSTDDALFWSKNNLCLHLKNGTIIQKFHVSAYSSSSGNTQVCPWIGTTCIEDSVQKGDVQQYYPNIPIIVLWNLYAFFVLSSCSNQSWILICATWDPCSMLMLLNAEDQATSRCSECHRVGRHQMRNSEVSFYCILKQHL